MKRPLDIILYPSFSKEFETICEWRQANGLNIETLKAEIEKTSRYLQETPAMGAPVPNARIAGTRKLLLGETGYYLYYHVNADRNHVAFITLHHVRRRPIKL